MKKKTVGIIGGSFDPIHLGHLNLAIEVQKQYQLTEILFIPCQQNPLKSHAPYASAEDRVKMIQLAIRPFEKFSIDRQEIERNTPSYTVSTLISLRKVMPNASFVLIMAFDAFSHLTKWKDWKKIIDYTHLIIANRLGASHAILQPELQTFFQSRKTDNIELIHTLSAGCIFEKTLAVPISISSTDIRRDIAAQKDIESWVPVSVKNYILTHRLYDPKLIS